MHRILYGTLLLAVCCSLLAAEQLSPAPTVMTPLEALSMIGKADVHVRLIVRQAKDRLEKRGIIFLDTEEDFNDPDNLGIAVSATVAKAFRERGIEDLASYLQGRTIEVNGCVMRFEERYYMPILKPEQLKIIDLK